MKLREVTASLLVFAVFLGQSKASAGMPSSIGSEIVQSTNQAAPDEKFEQRRQHFNSGRRLLLDKHVPFEPEDLLRDERPQQLKDALQTMPEMKEVRYETAPLTGLTWPIPSTFPKMLFYPAIPSFWPITLFLRARILSSVAHLIFISSLVNL